MAKNNNSDKKPYFDPVDPKVNFPKLEEKLLDYWYKKGIVKKYLQKNNNSKKTFSFLDGPITANNPMGVHHAWGRTYKDLWQRFYNMQGYKQRFQNGFDCQGLWVEVEVEKELGLKSKKDIENLVPGSKEKSIAKFVELCKERVFKFAKIQSDQSKKLGYFMDWDNSYYTLSDDNNFMIWHFLKKCQEKGLIYKGRDSVPWCPRCGTAISQHEMLTEDYKEVIHESIYFSLPVKNKDYNLLIWTTTPWTIPANVAVAINPDYYYRVWKELTTGKKYLVLNADQDNRGFEKDVMHRIISQIGGVDFIHDKNVKDIRGKDLLGEKYSGPFDELPAVRKAKMENPKTFHSVIPAKDLITADEGTGIVHIAPGAGTEDFTLGKEFDLPVIAPIDEESNYYEGFGDLTGKNAKKYPELILEILRDEKNNFLLATHNYEHRYPACWRCKTELVWRVVDEWYIAIDPVREDMKNIAKKINWIPEFGLKRELDWLNNMHDWLISKKRYWGLALPIWECRGCGNFDVIGSKEELKKLAVEGWDKFDGHSPHRPWIDEVKIKCSKCGEISERVPDVGNPWLDAGIVSFSTISDDNKSEPLYLKNKKVWVKWFPADFITESFPGQFKNWFYSLIAMSSVLEGREPFKNVLGFALACDVEGNIMHKSNPKTYISFDNAAQKAGSDVMRWIFLNQDPRYNLLFGWELTDQIRRKFHLTLWNIYNFFVTYANLDGWRLVAGKGITLKNLLDVWIVTRLKDTIVEVTENLKNFDARLATENIEIFVNDLSLWYIRRSRDRVGLNAIDRSDKENFYNVTYLILINLSRLLAPFTPFISDAIFINLSKTDSVHLADWPNNKEIELINTWLGKPAEVEKLMDQMAIVRKIVERGHARRKEKGIAVRQPLTSITVYLNQKLNPQLYKLIKDELNIKKVLWKKAKELEVKLDTKITPELEEEAKTRELVRSVQQKRKDMGIDLTQKVLINSPWLPKSKNMIQYLSSRTLAKDIKKGKKLEVMI